MARAAKLSKKKVSSKGNTYYYWQTKAYGGKTFGRTDQVTHKQALTEFGQFLSEQAELEPTARVKKSKSLTVQDVCELHLAWVKETKSYKTYQQRQTSLNDFLNHRVGTYRNRRLVGYGQKVAKLSANRLERFHLDDCRDTYAKTKTAKFDRLPSATSVRHLVSGVKACFNWAAETEDNDGGGLLPETFKPFAKVPQPKDDPRDLSEQELITDNEAKTLHRLAKQHNATFADMLKVYEATGARTAELTDLVVSDWMPKSGQLKLAYHKRTNTQKTYELRTMQVADPAVKMILQKHTAGKKPSEPIFLQPNGNPYNTDRVVKTFATLRAKTKRIRDHHTPYCFRHLYITDLLSTKVVPIHTVARMAGTSVEMIKKTYGHWYNADLADAQAELHALRKARASKKKSKRKAG